ncbi:MAG TPA: hypothetical protein VIV40_16755 [Kofleriaceae bacterium]
MKLTCAATVLGLALLGCSSETPVWSESTNEIGLDVTRLEDGLIEGKLVTQVGSVDFRSVMLEEGVFQISFQRDGRQFGSLVDWNLHTVDLQAPDGFQLTTDDRFVITALSSAVEEQIGKDMGVVDNLFRQSTAWGSHPEGALILTQIVSDSTRSWTTLCSAGACSCTPSRSFCESGSGQDNGHTEASHPSSTHCRTLYFGKCEGHNPCQSRCGGGCYSIGTSAWTQDCGNHDTCEHYHTSDCGGEWTSAADDFSFAPNCSC